MLSALPRVRGSCSSSLEQNDNSLYKTETQTKVEIAKVIHLGEVEYFITDWLKLLPSHDNKKQTLVAFIIVVKFSNYSGFETLAYITITWRACQTHFWSHFQNF